MTEHELRLTGRLHALEFLLAQTLSEILRPHTDTEKVALSARMRESLLQNVSSAPAVVSTAALEVADKILTHAVEISL